MTNHCSRRAVILVMSEGFPRCARCGSPLTIQGTRQRPPQGAATVSVAIFVWCRPSRRMQTAGHRGPCSAIGGMRELPALGPAREVVMRRSILIVAFALIVGSGAAVTTAQNETPQAPSPEAGQEVLCSTPVLDQASTAQASPQVGVADPLASPAATPLAVDACGTPAF
jgi:hypothetical protein